MNDSAGYGSYSYSDGFPTPAYYNSALEGFSMNGANRAPYYYDQTYYPPGMHGQAGSYGDPRAAYQGMPMPQQMSQPQQPVSEASGFMDLVSFQTSHVPPAPVEQVMPQNQTYLSYEDYMRQFSMQPPS